MMFLDFSFTSIGLGLLRYIGAGLCNIIYGLISRLFQLFMIISQLNILSSDEIQPIYQRITLILTIVMVFYITFQFVKYIVEPDAMTDKEKGVGNIVKRILIAIVLIAFVPKIFTIAYDVQNKLITNQVFSKVLLGEANIKFDTFGSAFSADVLGVFYGLNDEVCSGSNYDSECKEAETKVNENLRRLREDGEVTLIPGITGTKKVEVDGEKQDIALIRFDGLLAVIIGGFILYIVVLYTVDVATRYAQLIFLQIMSPIAIIGYISPKKDGIFNKWLKQCTTTYLDLFIRLSIIYFVLLIIDVLGDSFNSGSLFAGIPGVGAGYKTLAYIVLIMGLLVFAKKAPKMIGDLLPGGGAAGIGYGLKGGDRFSPTIGGLKRTWNAGKRTVGGAAGLIGGAYMGYKKGQKQKAWSATKAAYRGLKAGAGKGGGIRKGLDAGRKSINEDIDIIDKGGTPFQSDFRGGIHTDVSKQQDRIITKLKGFSKNKDVVTNTADEVKQVKQLKAEWESARAGGKSAAEIEAARKRYKAAQKTVLVGEITIDQNTGKQYLVRKDVNGNEVDKYEVDNEDLLRRNSALKQSEHLRADIKNDEATISIEIDDPNNPGKKKKMDVLIKDLDIEIDDPNNPGQKITKKVNELDEKQFIENLGLISTLAEEQAKEIERTDVYRTAHANGQNTGKQ